MCLKKKISWEPSIAWQQGTRCYDGNSNVAGMDVKKFLGPDWFNIGVGGARTDEVYGHVDALASKIASGDYRVDLYVCQVGGNNFWLEPFPELFIKKLEALIEYTKDKLPGIPLWYCSLPYIDPEQKVMGLRYNDLFATATWLMPEICQRQGVGFINIFGPLRSCYSKKRWIDAIHYGDYGRAVVAINIKAAVGL